jgi:sec-independent protein translocase protein TatB
MFEISFTELLLIMVVALVVIGPERLPKVARTLGMLWGRAQRYVNSVKADMERDLSISEMRELKEKVQAEALAAQQSVSQLDQHLDEQVRELNADIAKPLQENLQAIQQEGQNALKPPVNQTEATQQAKS